MGLSLQFAVGNKEEILNAVINDDFDFLDKIEVNGCLADFSLHLDPNDLNYLVNAASKLKGIQTMDLRQNLDFESHFFDSVDKGASLVNRRIPLLFSSFNTVEAKRIAQMWFAGLNSVYPNENINLTEDAAHSVESLITVLKKDIAGNEDLIHIWFL